MKPALLLIDFQTDYLKTAGLQPAAELIVARAAEILAACRKRHVAVIHVWTTVRRERDERLPHWRRDNRWMCVDGTPGHQPPTALAPENGELIIHKTGFNAFANPELEARLRQLDCDTVMIAGLHLHACVRAAAIECLERGRQVHIAEDAVGTNDPIHAAATRRWLSERCVQFESTQSLLSRLDGRGAQTLVHRSPRRTDQILFEVPVAGAAEISAATATAKTAWSHWHRTSMDERLTVLEKIATRFEGTAQPLARQMAIELGKPVSHAIEEIQRAVANIRDVIRRVVEIRGPKRQGPGFARRESIGVVAVISAWNNAVAIPIGKIAPALAFGNTVVWKPAPAATRISETMMQIFQEAGLLPGTVVLVMGDHSAGQRLAADNNVDAVTLTGSVLAGYAVQEICARRMVPLQAELSGNNAAIVWDESDFAHAAAEVAWGAFAFAGQRCTANRRVIVPASQSDKLSDAIAAAAERLIWGDPEDAATEIGPVISGSKRDEIEWLTARAENEGRRVVRLQSQRSGEAWVKKGAYAQPVIIQCNEPADLVVQEESMGPLLVIQAANDFDHALALCNGVRHGLIAALFSHSVELRRKFLEEARAGVLKFDAATAGVDVALPFGGWKASGIGSPEHGEADQLFYTRLQAVYGAPS